MSPSRRSRPSRHRRLAAYALVVRDGEVLLTRLAPHLGRGRTWTLPGGEVEHGEHPRDAVVREVAEETGLAVSVEERPAVDSLHRPRERRDGEVLDLHAVRLVYRGQVARGAPAPRVVEVGGSTAEAAWQPVAAVLDGDLPVLPFVREAVAEAAARPPLRHQRVAAYALVVARERVLLTRVSGSGFHTGRWSLPGGGVDHGEHPRAAVVRELAEETGLVAEVGELLVVDDERIEGTAPSGREEDFHSVAIVYAATVPADAEPRVVEGEGTTDAVAWVPLADVEAGVVPVLDLVATALAAR